MRRSSSSLRVALSIFLAAKICEMPSPSADAERVRAAAQTAEEALGDRLGRRRDARLARQFRWERRQLRNGRTQAFARGRFRRLQHFAQVFRRYDRNPALPQAARPIVPPADEAGAPRRLAAREERPPILLRRNGRPRVH